MNKPTEKRKFVRLKAKYLTRHIKYKLPGVDIYPNQDSESKDISAGGVLFASVHSYAVGDILRMELHVPGWEKYRPQAVKTAPVSRVMPLLVLGKVVRVRSLGQNRFDIGAAFVGIDECDELALTKYITGQLKEK